MKPSPSLNRIIAFLAAPHILFYALPWFMALLIVATVTQPALGLYLAVDAFMNSWIIWAGPLPLPGGWPTLGALTVNLLVRFLFKSEWSWAKAGIHLTHFGVLVLLVGGLLTSLMAREGYMIIPEGRTSDVVYAYQNGEVAITPPTENGQSMIWGTQMETLPFSLTLNDFERIDYPGTQNPRAYYSDIIVHKSGQDFPTRIEMNEPLRLAGYTVFQSSFIDVGEHQATVLQVVHNNARLLPYISTFLMAAGLMLHIALRYRRAS